jgi:hypothetical protein
VASFETEARCCVVAEETIYAAVGNAVQLLSVHGAEKKQGGLSFTEVAPLPTRGAHPLHTGRGRAHAPRRVRELSR